MPAGSAGNGAAIRAAPVGLFSYDDIPSLVTFAKQQAFVTHQVLNSFQLYKFILYLFII